MRRVPEYAIAPTEEITRLARYYYMLRLVRPAECFIVFRVLSLLWTPTPLAACTRGKLLPGTHRVLWTRHCELFCNSYGAIRIEPSGMLFHPPLRANR